jgi:hypothetical protein
VTTPLGVNGGAGGDLMADGTVKVGLGAGRGGNGVGAGCELHPDGTLKCGTGVPLAGEHNLGFEKKVNYQAARDAALNQVATGQNVFVPPELVANHYAHQGASRRLQDGFAGIVNPGAVAGNGAQAQVQAPQVPGLLKPGEGVTRMEFSVSAEQTGLPPNQKGRSQAMEGWLQAPEHVGDLLWRIDGAFLVFNVTNSTGPTSDVAGGVKWFSPVRIQVVHPDWAPKPPGPIPIPGIPVLGPHVNVKLSGLVDGSEKTGLEGEDAPPVAMALPGMVVLGGALWDQWEVLTSQVFRLDLTDARIAPRVSERGLWVDDVKLGLGNKPAAEPPLPTPLPTAEPKAPAEEAAEEEKPVKPLPRQGLDFGVPTPTQAPTAATTKAPKLPVAAPDADADPAVAVPPKVADPAVAAPKVVDPVVAAAPKPAVEAVAVPKAAAPLLPGAGAAKLRGAK